MNHEPCVDNEQLFAFAHHLLDRREESAVAAHLECCAACAQILAEYRKLDSVLDEWKPAAPSAWFDARVRAAVASEQSRPRFAFFGLRWAQVLTPVCLLLLVVAASLIVTRPHSNQSWQPSAGPVTLREKTAAKQVEEELTLYKDLPVLEDDDYQMLANFDVLSELPHGEEKVEN